MPSEAFREQLGQLEEEKKKVGEKLAEAENSVVHNVPSQVYLQYLTLQRELLGKVNALLTQQYEMAKIEEAREDLSFNIIDSAVAPVHPSKPKRLLIVGVAFVGGLFLSIFVAFFLEYVQKMKAIEKESSESKRG